MISRPRGTLFRVFGTSQRQAVAQGTAESLRPKRMQLFVRTPRFLRKGFLSYLFISLFISAALPPIWTQEELLLPFSLVMRLMPLLYDHNGALAHL